MNYIGVLHVVKFVIDRQKGSVVEEGSDRPRSDAGSDPGSDHIDSDNPLLLRFIGTNNFSLRNQ